MSRPIPNFPRGPKQLRAVSQQILLAIPRISPEWELSTIAALMKPKPKTRDAVRHRDSHQPWSAPTRTVVEATCVAALKQLVLDLEIHYPDRGEYFVFGEGLKPQEESLRALALAISRAVPTHWVVVGRLFLRASKFYRRKRGYLLELVPANDVHLSRDVRRKMRGLI